MAETGRLDFGSFIEERRQKLPDGGRDSGLGYAYASDKSTRRVFETVKPVEVAVRAAVRAFEEYGRTELLGRAVKVGPKQIPRVHHLANQCANQLGIAPPTVYIVNSPVMNAATFGTNEESVIMIHSALIDAMSDEELLSVIGHECGHIHNNHVIYLTAIYYLQQMAGALAKVVLAPAQIPLMGWLRRAEITCDRAGLLCCKSLEASTKALTKLALGSSKLYAELNMEAFVEQYEELKGGVGRYAEARMSHPYLPKRVIALRHFAESSFYKRHVSLPTSTSDLSMEQVDAKVFEVIKIFS